jgi:polyferredoxin
LIRCRSTTDRPRDALGCSRAFRLREARIRFLTRLLFAAYFIEAGLLLIVAPWTLWWWRNAFAEAWPWVGTFMALRAVRVAVSVAGLTVVLAGMAEARQLFGGRWRSTGSPSAGS